MFNHKKHVAAFYSHANSKENWLNIPGPRKVPRIPKKILRNNNNSLMFAC